MRIILYGLNCYIQGHKLINKATNCTGRKPNKSNEIEAIESIEKSFQYQANIIGFSVRILVNGICLIQLGNLFGLYFII